MTNTIFAMEQTVGVLEAQLISACLAVSRMRYEHTTSVADMNAKVQCVLAARSSTACVVSGDEYHQLKLKCHRLETERLSLCESSARLAVLEQAEEARQRAWCGLDPVEIGLILRYERAQFEVSPQTCVLRRMELRYNREAMERTVSICDERVRAAEQRLKEALQLAPELRDTKIRMEGLEQRFAVVSLKARNLETELGMVLL